MLKKLDKLILKEFLGPFFMTYFIVLFILLLQSMLHKFKHFIGKDLGFDVFAELFFHFATSLTQLALPLSVLLASLMTFGSLGEHSELTAIKASGVSLTRILRPVAVLVLFITIGAVFFNDRIFPQANLKAYSLLWDIREKKATLDLKDGVFYNGLPGYSIKTERKIKSKVEGIPDTLLNMMIYNHTNNKGNVELILAKRGVMDRFYYNDEEFLRLRLEEGNWFIQEDNPSENAKISFQRNAFDTSTIIFSMESFGMKKTRTELFEHHNMMKTIEQLDNEQDSVGKTFSIFQQDYHRSIYANYPFALDSSALKDDALADSLIEVVRAKKTEYTDYDYALNKATAMKYVLQANLATERMKREQYLAAILDYHKRYTISVAVLMMFLIGAPLGAIIKKGGLGVPVLISIIFFVIFYVTQMIGEKYAKENIVHPIVGCWTSIWLLLAFGLYFLKQAYQDARLFDMDYYAVLWEKTKIILKKRTT